MRALSKALLAGAGLVSGLGLIGAVTPRSEPECKVAARWVEAHSDSLPESVAALSKYRAVYRRAIYNKFPSSVKRTLWEQHFDVIARRANLTQDQLLLVAAVRANLRQYLDSSSGKSAIKRDRIVERIKSTFSADDARDFFATLGAPDPTRNLASSGTPFIQAALVNARGNNSLGEAARRLITVARTGTCQCSTQTSFCGGGWECKDGTGCQVDTGCGFLWSELCNGFCYGTIRRE